MLHRGRYAAGETVNDHQTVQASPKTVCKISLPLAARQATRRRDLSGRMDLMSASGDPAASFEWIIDLDFDQMGGLPAIYVLGAPVVDLRS